MTTFTVTFALKFDRQLLVKSLVVVYPFRDLSIRGQAVSSGGMGSAPSRCVWSGPSGL